MPVRTTNGFGDLGFALPEVLETGRDAYEHALSDVPSTRNAALESATDEVRARTALSDTIIRQRNAMLSPSREQNRAAILQMFDRQQSGVGIQTVEQEAAMMTALRKVPTKPTAQDAVNARENVKQIAALLEQSKHHFKAAMERVRVSFDQARDAIKCGDERTAVSSLDDMEDAITAAAAAGREVSGYAMQRAQLAQVARLQQQAFQESDPVKARQLAGKANAIEAQEIEVPEPLTSQTGAPVGVGQETSGDPVQDLADRAKMLAAQADQVQTTVTSTISSSAKAAKKAASNAGSGIPKNVKIGAGILLGVLALAAVIR